MNVYFYILCGFVSIIIFLVFHCRHKNEIKLLKIKYNKEYRAATHTCQEQWDGRAEYLNLWNALMRENYGAYGGAVDRGGNYIWRVAVREFVKMTKATNFSVEEIRAIKKFLIVYGKACLHQDEANRKLIPETDKAIEFDDEGGFKIVEIKNAIRDA